MTDARRELEQLVYEAGIASGAGTIAVDDIVGALLDQPDVMLRALGGEQTTGEYSSTTGHEYAARWRFPTHCCAADTAGYYGDEN